MDIPSTWQHWLDKEGKTPLNLQDPSLNNAAAWEIQTSGRSVEEMRQRYCERMQTIGQTPASMSSLSFRVSYGGGHGVVVILDNI
ncbi:MAG: hypothetical protein RLZZ165_2122 [Bacteroidota bacterium]